MLMPGIVPLREDPIINMRRQEELITRYESKMKALLEMDDDDPGKRQVAEDL